MGDDSVQIVQCYRHQSRSFVVVNGWTGGGSWCFSSLVKTQLMPMTHTDTFSNCARFHWTGEKSLRASLPPSTACSWLQAQALLTDDPLGLPCLPSCPLPGLAPQTDVVRALLAHSPCTLCASARLQLLGAGGRVQDNIGQALAVTVPQSPGCPVGLSTYLLPRHGRSRPSPGYLTYLPTSRHLVCYWPTYNEGLVFTGMRGRYLLALPTPDLQGLVWAMEYLARLLMSRHLQWYCPVRTVLYVMKDLFFCL